jgi:chloramphenicol 3-O-phosphotransferase
METQVRGVILLTGVMAAGKSTVAQRLAEHLPLSVHLRGDVFRRMIVNGRAEMEKGFSERAFELLRLRYHLAAVASDLYCDAGFTVVYQDVIIGPILREVVEDFQRQSAGQPLHVVVLCPAPEVIAAREAARAKKGYSTWAPADLDSELRANTPRLGLWLDTSALSVEETVEAVLARLDKALIQS